MSNFSTENPSLTQVSRDRHAPIIPVQTDSSILDWLERNGRLIPRDIQDVDLPENEEEIAELMAGDDSTYDDDDEEPSMDDD